MGFTQKSDLPIDLAVSVMVSGLSGLLGKAE